MYFEELTHDEIEHLKTPSRIGSKYRKQYLSTWKCKSCENKIYFQALKCPLCGGKLKNVTVPRKSGAPSVCRVLPAKGVK